MEQAFLDRRCCWGEHRLENGNPMIFGEFSPKCRDNFLFKGSNAIINRHPLPKQHNCDGTLKVSVVFLINILFGRQSTTSHQCMSVFCQYKQAQATPAMIPGGRCRLIHALLLFSLPKNLNCACN